MKLWLQFWKWPRAISKLKRIRAISGVYFNDTKFKRITDIIDE